MKKKEISILIVINLFIVVLFAVTFIYTEHLQNHATIRIYYGEGHTDEDTAAELFWTDNENDFTVNNMLVQEFNDDVVSFEINGIDFENNIIRLDPINKLEDFSISRIDVVLGIFRVFRLTGEDITGYIDMVGNMEYEMEDGFVKCAVMTGDPVIIMKKSFSEMIHESYGMVNELLYTVFFLIYIFLEIIQAKLIRVQKQEKNRKSAIPMMIAELLVGIGVAGNYIIFYFEKHFGDVPFGQLVYHLHTPLDGTEISSYAGVILLGIALVAGFAAVFFVIYKYLKDENNKHIYIMWVNTLGVIMVVLAAARGCEHFGLVDYYKYTHEKTKLYDEYYVDGRDIDIVFPVKKRNLIYIYLESMEITYADTASGGAMKKNYIPELTKLALENNSFSDGNELNGAYHVSGATYTMGALAAQTSGVPINETLVSNDILNGSWESENNYLPGVWSLGDILEQEGYNQEFMIGSEGTFAGRSSYFKGHGNYKISDYNTAIEEGRISEDYKVWWGYEDEKLFSYAKEDITELAKKGEPFNFTMLTVDTHATDGYVCELCEGKYDQQYSNVLACSSRQTADFVRWIQEQDFYENTTVILAGDHLTMDSYYIDNTEAGNYDRRTYFTIINPAAGKGENEQRRMYTTLDLYPTTLSSLGVTIEGSRLGLGVDLYSDVPTLVEEYGLEDLDMELMKNSVYYTKKLLYK